MRWMLVVPLLVGAATVVQGGFNRWVSEQWGLASMLVLNNLILLLLSVGLWAVVVGAPGWFPDFFADRGQWLDVRWWWAIPAVAGLIIVGGIPWAFSRLDAVVVIVGIVVAQLVGAFLWDTLVDGKPIEWLRVAGAALAIAGVVLASWPTQR